MDFYFEKIMRSISDFCQMAPGPGGEIVYLDEAKRLLSLHAKALGIIEKNNHSATAEKEMKEVFLKVKMIVYRDVDIENDFEVDI